MYADFGSTICSLAPDTNAAPFDQPRIKQSLLPNPILKEDLDMQVHTGVSCMFVCSVCRKLRLEVSEHRFVELFAE